MGLRLDEGIDLARIAARAGVARDALIDEAAARRLAGQGFVTRDGDRIGVTGAGMILLDAILPQLVATA